MKHSSVSFENTFTTRLLYMTLRHFKLLVEMHHKEIKCLFDFPFLIMYLFYSPLVLHLKPTKPGKSQSGPDQMKQTVAVPY